MDLAEAVIPSRLAGGGTGITGRIGRRGKYGEPGWGASKQMTTNAQRSTSNYRTTQPFGSMGRPAAFEETGGGDRWQGFVSSFSLVDRLETC
jgi:hypothetical protein